MSINSHQEYRCRKCNKLLAIAGEGGFELKCKRCGMLNVVLEQMIEQVIVTDPNGIVLYTNDALERVTGFTAEEVIGKTPALWGGQMPKEFYEDMWRAIKMEKKNIKVNLVNRKKDGTHYSCELCISPILNTDGSIRFFVGIEKVVTS